MTNMRVMSSATFLEITFLEVLSITIMASKADRSKDFTLVLTNIVATRCFWIFCRYKYTFFKSNK